MDAVANVDPTGSRPANGTTKKSIDTAGKNTVPTRAIGTRTVSSRWNRAWVRARDTVVSVSGAGRGFHGRRALFRGVRGRHGPRARWSGAQAARATESVSRAAR